MNQQLIRPDRFFFGTRSLPCPYLEGKTERKVVTDLSGPNAGELYERLSRAGFRRSHSLAYRPACPSCSACVPVRINATEFQWTKSFRRVVRTNSDLTADDIEAIATVEQYRLFSSYQRKRHEGGDMSGMDFGDYRAMIEDTPVSSRTVEFRDVEGRLVAVMLMDRMEDSLSAVYSFFDGSDARRSLGTYMILWMI
ncbi:MAG: arginyl-transferase family protein, partial [Alphaproteobacteria bacterium]